MYGALDHVVRPWKEGIPVVLARPLFNVLLQKAHISSRSLRHSRGWHPLLGSRPACIVNFMSEMRTRWVLCN